MYQTETLDAVRDGAQQLTREGKVLTLGNPEFPLAVFADTYQVDAEPTNTPLPDQEMVAVEDHFDEINQDSTPAGDDSREAVVNNLFNAISKIQFNTSNIIVPAVKAMHQTYAGMQQTVSQAEYAVKPWRYLAPHDSPVLVNHVNTRYVNVRPKETYDSYELHPVTADAVIEMMAINNPHLEQEEVTEWALQVGSDRIVAVWTSLFGQPGPVVPAGLPYLSATHAPFNVDDILTAYFICGHYIDNPEQTPDQSVDLEDWQHTMKLMHEMFGFYLMRAYLRRIEAREDGELILRNEAISPIETRRAVVVVNGDVFDPWIVGGGDFQAVLGAAIENTGVTNLRHIEAGADKFVARWHAIYPMIKQSAIDYAERQCINNVISTFREVANGDLLKDRWSQDIEAKLKDSLRYLRRDDYENPYKVFSTLICRVYFPEDTYFEYLDAIDSLGQDFPKATVRELNTQATLSLVALFLSKQILIEAFIPEIDPNAVSEGGAIDDSGLLAVVDFDSDGEETAEVTDVSEQSGDLSGDFSETETTGVVEDGDEFSETTEVVEDGVTGDEGPDDSGLGEAVETETTEDDSDFGDEEEEEDPYSDLEDTESETEETETEEEESEAGEEEADAENSTVDEAAEEPEEAEEEETAEDEEDDTPLA